MYRWNLTPQSRTWARRKWGIWGLRMRGLACAHGVVTEARPGDAASDTEAPTGTGPRAERALGDCELVARAVSSARNTCDVACPFAMGLGSVFEGPRATSHDSHEASMQSCTWTRTGRRNVNQALGGCATEFLATSRLDRPFEGRQTHRGRVEQSIDDAGLSTRIGGARQVHVSGP
jgi:hypothetical protein